MKTYQKEGISIPSVQKKNPASPIVRALSASKDLSKEQSDDHANEFIPAIGDEVEELAVVGNREEVHGDFEDDDLEDHDTEGGGCGGAKEFRVEGATHAGEDSGEEDVCDEGHNRDVHVW